MNTTVVLFPGLGADHRLFRFQHAVLPDLVIPPWPATAANDSLASFAGRFVDSIPKVKLQLLKLQDRRMALDAIWP